MLLDMENGMLTVSKGSISTACTAERQEPGSVPALMNDDGVLAAPG